MICRLCLTETEFCLPLKNVENQEKDEETEDIVKIIKKHFNLELNIDCDFVCTVCWQQISEFHTFYLFIEEKQKELSQQGSLPPLTGTRNDSTDNKHKVVMKEVAAKYGNGMGIKNEYLIDLNAPVVKENSLSQGSKEATLQEATENLDIKNEFIDYEASYCEPSATPIETDSEYEMDVTDEMYMKNECLIEISSPMITENSLGQWKKGATENLEDVKNVELIDQVDTEPESCETNDVAETARIQQTKITPPEQKKQNLNKKIRREKSDLIIAKHAGILKCELCAQTMETFGNLKQHFKKKHGRNGYVRCCNKRYYLHYTYAEHLEWHSNQNLWKCEPCNLVYSCRNSYDSHLLQVHPEEENSKLKCIICPARFSKVYLLLRHIENKHSEKSFKCDKSNKELTTVPGLKYHKKTIHLRTDRTECDICGKSFANSTSCMIHKEKKHKNDCHNEQKRKCNECNKEFKDKYKLKQHIKTIHLRFYEMECDICCKMFACRTHLNIHKARFHEIEENLNFQCSLCPKKFALKSLLNAHRKDSHCKQTPECDECGKGFKSWSIVKSHIKRVHQRAYDIECDICGKTIANRNLLTFHKARVHAADANLNFKFQCPNCPKKFAHKSLLNTHRRYIHSNQKFKCDECDKEYKNLDSLGNHKRQYHKIFASSTRFNIQKAERERGSTKHTHKIST